MEIKKVISQLENLKEHREDYARGELFPETWQADVEALDYANKVLREKELSGADTPKELQLINISRK